MGLLPGKAPQLVRGVGGMRMQERVGLEGVWAHKTQTTGSFTVLAGGVDGRGISDSLIGGFEGESMLSSGSGM